MIFDINVRKQNRTKIVQNSPAMIKRKKKSARITNEIRFMKGAIFMKSKKILLSGILAVALSKSFPDRRTIENSDLCANSPKKL